MLLACYFEQKKYQNIFLDFVILDCIIYHEKHTMLKKKYTIIENDTETYDIVKDIIEDCKI